MASAAGSGKRKPQRGRGCPTKLTPRLQNEMVRWLKRGAHIEHVCRYVGIQPRTYYNWLERGRAYEEAQIEGRKPQAKDRIYFVFLQSVERARAKAAMDATTMILAIGKRNADWRALGFFLERSYPDIFGRRRLEHTGRGGGPIATLNAGLPLEALSEAELSDLYAQMLRDEDDL